MSLKKIGIVKAHIPGVQKGQGLKYVPVGVAFKDDERDGRIAIKLNAMPLDKRWDGWLNVFDEEYPAQAQKDGDNPPLDDDPYSDDIPF